MVSDLNYACWMLAPQTPLEQTVNTKEFYFLLR